MECFDIRRAKRSKHDEPDGSACLIEKVAQRSTVRLADCRPNMFHLSFVNVAKKKSHGMTSSLISKSAAMDWNCHVVDALARRVQNLRLNFENCTFFKF
jgi:hypothetical protein